MVKKSPNTRQQPLRGVKRRLKQAENSGSEEEEEELEKRVEQSKHLSPSISIYRKLATPLSIALESVTCGTLNYNREVKNSRNNSNNNRTLSVIIAVASEQDRLDSTSQVSRGRQDTFTHFYFVGSYNCKSVNRYASPTSSVQITSANHSGPPTSDQQVSTSRRRVDTKRLLWHGKPSSLI